VSKIVSALIQCRNDLKTTGLLGRQWLNFGKPRLEI
jgi:hypothetical protein